MEDPPRSGLRCGLLLRVAGDGRSCAVSPAFYTELRRPVFSPVLFFAPLAAECTDRLLLSCEASSREYTQLLWRSKSGKIAPQPIEGSIPVLHISGMLPACFISLSSMSGTRELHLVLVVSKKSKSAWQRVYVSCEVNLWPSIFC